MNFQGVMEGEMYPNRPIGARRGYDAQMLGAIYLQLNADLQMKASGLGDVTFLSDGEVAAVLRTRGPFTFERAWEFWCRRAGRPYGARPMEGPLARAPESPR